MPNSAMSPERIIQSGFVNRFNWFIEDRIKKDLFKNLA